MKKILLVLQLLCGLHWALSAQNETPIIASPKVEIPVLVFEHLDKGEIKFVRETGGITYALRSNPKKKISGILEKVKPNSMIINGQEIQFADCAYIKGKVRTDRDLIGGMLVGLGTGAMAFGGVFIGSIPGAAIVAVGGVSLANGIALVTKRKKFHLDKGWQVYGGSISYQR